MPPLLLQDKESELTQARRLCRNTLWIHPCTLGSAIHGSARFRQNLRTRFFELWVNSGDI